MPAITLRSLRSDLAYKLDQLEVRASVLERDARNAVPIDLPPPAEPFGVRAASFALAIAQGAVGAVRGAHASLGRAVRSPRLAFALRVVRGSINDAFVCISVASVMLLAWVLALLIVAPPD